MGATATSNTNLDRVDVGAPLSVVGKTGAPEAEYSRVGIGAGDKNSSTTLHLLTGIPEHIQFSHEAGGHAGRPIRKGGLDGVTF
ncbi:hypothetical protein QMK17_24375 [Rhodococcus sp. G-MC3]|uniref:hypothetical protein n=1 Tax=Rhodococcus sp. G-MC3 TaxID=3046209 RepID=UPI0024BB34CA|nr:hypothetical protein [Rhodococcus sp. G-MC3]MDJ0396444.1 hypothetical protein [Rhodococcus sp. G-MC3]